jgi:hypothetical protein
VFEGFKGVVVERARIPNVGFGVQGETNRRDVRIAQRGSVDGACGAADVRRLTVGNTDAFTVYEMAVW